MKIRNIPFTAKQFFAANAVLLVLALLAGRFLLPQPAAKEAPSQPNDWFFLQRSFPDKDINYEALAEARRQAKALHASTASRHAGLWEQMGPTNIGGRITALAIHPSQPDRIYAGAADGGVWYSENSGGNWIPVFDFNSTLSIGAMAIDPNDPNTLYVGTGEANISADSYPGNGLFKSTDGGASWGLSGLENSHHIGRIAINPQNSQQVFVAASGLLFGKNAERGIYRSNDGGQSWTQVLFISDSTSAIDVVIDPLNPSAVYAAMWERIRTPGARIAGGITSGIFKSTDGGESWDQLLNGLPAPSPTVGRIGLSIAPSNPQVLYAIYADHPGYFAGVFKTTNGGSSWSQVNDGALGNLYSSFGWYFGNIYVDPSNENTVYVLGVPMYKTTNGGSSWSTVGNDMHVDHHAIWVNPNNPQEVWVGNDGGLYVSQNGAASFSHFDNMPISQFYAGAVDVNYPERLYGGTQDNGTLRTLGGSGSWQHILGGDGFYVVIDPTNSNVLYAEYQWGGLQKTTTGGPPWSSATTGISSGDRTKWMTPVVMDPSNNNVLYYGTQRVWRTTNGAASWQAISSDLSNGPYPTMSTFGTVTTIDVAAGDPDVIYAGTDDGNLWVTADGGANWSLISASMPQRWVTRVTVHPTDPATVIVTFSGFRSGENMGHIFRSTDMGASWEDISNNLPEAPIQVMRFDPDYPDYYYVGSDLGVYYSLDAGSNWAVLGENYPAAGVADLMVHAATRTLTAATHGRSMLRIDISNLTALRPGEARPADTFTLENIYPNPFNSQAQIEFVLHRALPVEVAVYDILGRRVTTLNNGPLAPGRHRLSWDGRSEYGVTAASGVYLVRIAAGPSREVRRIILAR